MNALQTTLGPMRTMCLLLAVSAGWAVFFEGFLP